MRQDGNLITILLSAMKAFMLGWGMVVLYVVLNSFGSLTLKNQVQEIGQWSFTTTRSYFAYFIALFSSWKTWISIGAITAATGAWIVALANLELSRAYPVAIGLNLLIVVTLSFFVFHEPISISKILGAVLILSGVICLFR